MSAPGGLPARLVALGEALRAHGVAVGTSELLDATAALGAVPWADPGAVREALGATLAKSPRDRAVLDAAVEAMALRGAEGAALALEPRGAAPPDGAAPGLGGAGGDRAEDERPVRIDVDGLRERVARALAEGEDGALRDLARLAVAALAREPGGSGVLGVDLQRVRRALGLPRPGEAERPGPAAERVRRFERHLRDELERRRIAAAGALGPARPLAELDRALPSGARADQAEVHRVVAQLRRRLATSGRESRGRRRLGPVDVRRTMHASLGTGGVPVALRHRPRRPRRPELVVACDVSTSVSAASAFFLAVLHALHDAFRRMRSFVFVERVTEVTDAWAGTADLREVSRRITGEAGVADVSGYTDYGRVWAELDGLVGAALRPRTVLIVLGDGRGNGRDPGRAAFAQLAGRAGRTLWLHPEPRLYWDYGDSAMREYLPHCEAFECWTAEHLEAFARRLAAGAGGRAR